MNSNMIYTPAGKILSFFIGLTLILIISCKPEEFPDTLSKSSVVYFNYPGSLSQVAVGQFTKTAANVVIPVEISLEETSSGTFDVTLSSDPGAATSAITVQSLANAVVITKPQFTMPEVTEVRFGTKKATFNITLPISTIERNFEKLLVMSITLSNAAKGNLVNANKKTVVFTLNTLDVASLNELHFLSFKDASTSANKAVPVNALPANTTQDANSLMFTPQVDLGGSVGKSFSATISLNQDTIASLKAAGVLPAGTLLLPSSAISLNDAFIAKDQALARPQISVQLSALLLAYPAKYAFAITLSNPELYQLNKAKNTVVYLIDPLRVLNDITLLLQNPRQPFLASGVDPVGGRWGKLAGWISNDEANKRVAGESYGSLDMNNNTQIAFESGFSGPPAANTITNGKIYQVVALPAGTYTFNSTPRAASNIATDNTKGVYAVAARSTVAVPFPDLTATNTPANILGRASLQTAGDKPITFTLTGTGTTNVALGYLGILSGSQSMNIQSLTLTRTLNP